MLYGSIWHMSIFHLFFVKSQVMAVTVDLWVPAAPMTVPVFLGDLGSVGEFPVQLERWHVARWEPLKTMTYPLVMSK